MAIIKCPECGQDVSDTCEKCIHCGYQLRKPSTPTSVSSSSYSKPIHTESHASKIYERDQHIKWIGGIVASVLCFIIAKVITSDDIFSEINYRINKNYLIIKQTNDQREKYKELNSGTHKYTNLTDYDELMKARRSTLHQYTRSIEDTKIEINSNGETAIGKFYNSFEENGLYLLDEPENCLSPIFQIELIKLIEESARYFNCQFIIATHSPLILSINEAKIYDLDAVPVDTKKWYELQNVKIYFDFFMKNKDKF